MGCLKFQSLEGFWIDLTERKQLTPVSTDIFVSIPERDFGTSSLSVKLLRLYITILKHFRKVLQILLLNKS